MIPILSLLCALGPVLTTATRVSQTHNTENIAKKIVSRQEASNIQNNPNGSQYLWVPQDTYEGKTFFDDFTFFPYYDPTHGLVNYLDEQDAMSQGLTYVQDDGKVIMKADDTTWLPYGANRSSVRLSSVPSYNGGLFILDVDRVPWGCAVWPAWWTVGPGWPAGGEIDIIEGVHDNEHNQVAFHTSPGCNLTSTTPMTGQIKTNGDGSLNTECNGLINDNSGCGITEWSNASYGPTFDASGGGVFAMKWDENGIAVWSFYRAAVPLDILNNVPAPSGWGTPVAQLSPQGCGPLSNYFSNHSITFDITLCGDWAGSSYATTPGCPGTCQERLMDPGNFVNASFIINSLKVYRKQPFSVAYSGAITNGISLRHLIVSCAISVAFAIVF